MRVFVLALAAVLTACADAPAEPAASGSGLPTDASALALAVTEAGEVAAWVHEGRFHVLPAGATAPVVVDSAVSSHSQAGPRLAVASDGGLVAAYVVERKVEGRRFPASDLHLVRSEDGGQTWSEPVRPYADPGFPTGHTFHSLAAGPDGAVVVIWLDGTARDAFRREQAATTASARTTVPIRLVHDGETHETPTDEPGTVLMSAHSTDGGRTFAAPVPVADGTCQCCRTDLHVAADGSAYAIWRHIFDNSERDIALARSSDGGATWNAPVKVHADGWALDGCPHAGPAVTTDAEGAVHVAWPTGAEGREGMWRSISTDGGATFADPVRLGTTFGQVRATTANGQAVLAVEDPLSTTIRAFAIGATDTLRVTGDGADLSADPSGWHLLYHDGTAARVASL
ncbi:MAG: sialidase family protein [Bacteroidota bacterium]